MLPATPRLSYFDTRQWMTASVNRKCFHGLSALPQCAATSQCTNPHLPMKTLITYLAEDHAIVVENLIEALREIADVIVTAHAGTQLEASYWLDMQDGNWHLAIVDLFLKQGSGLGILAGCRDRAWYQKVVVLTNYATPEIRQRAIALRADAVFDKSTELDALFAYCREQKANLCKEDVQRAGCEAIARGRPGPG